MQKTNIRDIARLAGVGVSTVSRVINNHPDVSEETRQKILRIIEDSGYIPNSSARNLKISSSDSIGILVKGGYNPFFSEIIESIEKLFGDSPYSIVLQYNDDRDNDMEIASQFIQEKRLEGLICLGGNFKAGDEAYIRNLKAPIVMASASISDEIAKDIYSSVSIKDEESAYIATNYLVGNGHDVIGLIYAGYFANDNGLLRKKGYERALSERGLGLDESLMRSANYSFDSSHQAARDILESRKDITALFATSDIMAIGAIKGIQSMGLRVPDDVSVIGFDGIDYGRYYNPSLTTIKQPIKEIGQISAKMMFGLLENPSAHTHVILETELVKRESSGLKNERNIV